MIKSGSLSASMRARAIAFIGGDGFRRGDDDPRVVSARLDMNLFWGGPQRVKRVVYVRSLYPRRSSSSATPSIATARSAMRPKPWAGGTWLRPISANRIASIM